MKERILIFIILFFTISLGAQSAGDEDLSLSIDTIISPACHGNSNGRIVIKDIAIPGIVSSYEWSNGSTNRNLDNVPAGDYVLTVIAQNGKEYTSGKITIREPDPIHIGLDLFPPTAADSTNGFVDVKITGGTPPYSLAMVSELDTVNLKTDSESSLPDISTGVYWFYVMDANNCIDSTRLDVTPQSCELLATYVVTPAECENNPTGSIELFIENEIPPLSIEWSNGVKNKTKIDKLDQGEYQVKISDRRGCELNGHFKIEYEDLVPPQVFVVENVNLYLDAEGQATLEQREFLVRAEDKCHNDLTYELEKTNFTCEDLGLNEVNFHVTDGAGNVNTKTIMVNVRDTHAVELIYEDTVYTALCNGIAQYPPPMIRGLCDQNSTSGIVKQTDRDIEEPGTYKDVYYYINRPGDTMWAEITVVVQDHNVRAFLIVQPPDCNRGDDGSISVALRDEQQPVEYEWNDGSKEDFIFGIRHGQDYSVTIREGNGCWFELSARTDGPDSLRAELADLREHDGTVDIISQVSGGNPPLSYEWRASGEVIGFTKNLIGVPEGPIYTLEVFDAKNCRSNILRVDRSLTAADGNDLIRKVNIFPNPGSSSHSEVHVDLGDVHGNFKKIILMNHRQEIVQIQHPRQRQIRFSTSDLPAGIYFIQLISKEGKTFTKKYLIL